jgi:hypothetical protein
MLNFNWSNTEVEKFKQTIRDIWNYKPVNKIPINFTILSNPKKYTLHEQIKDVDKQLEVSLNSIKRTLELVPIDYIPIAGPDIGNVLIENAFGLKSVFPDNPEQTPIWTEPLIKSIDGIYKIQIPNPSSDKFFQDSLERLIYWVSKLDGRIYTGNYDIGSPINTAFNLMGSNFFYESLVTNPAAVHNLLEKITQTFIIYYALLIDAAGGINNMASIYFSNWSPEGFKGCVADDICANISPEMFNEFSKPYNSRIYRIFGPGIFHNCGPNPCLGEYISHDPPIRACHIFYDYSKDDLSRFGKEFAYKAILYVGWWGYDKPEKVIKEYRDVCEKLSPKTIAILQYSLDGSLYSDNDILDIYNELNKISIEYTKSIIWPNRN